jgi:hypothetical protein
LPGQFGSLLSTHFLPDGANYGPGSGDAYRGHFFRRADFAKPLQRMFKAFEFCLPPNATKVPASPK